MTEQELAKFENNQTLCRLCIHSRIKRGKGFVCNLTAETPDFYAYCPTFKVFIARDDKYNQGKFESYTGLTMSLAFCGFLTLILFASKINIAITLSILSVVLTGFSIYYSRLPKVVITAGWFPFLYFLALKFITNEKEFSGEAEINIIKQQIIKQFGRVALISANDLFAEKNIDFDAFFKNSNKISIEEKIFILSMACQVLVFNNIENYKKSDTIKKLMSFLKMPMGYISIKERYLNKEKKYQQRLKDEQNKTDEQKSSEGNTIYEFSNEKFYKVLGLDSKVTDQQLKKRFRFLALKFHPDRFVTSSFTEQHNAAEKFKEISEAYNRIKRLRNI